MERIIRIFLCCPGCIRTGI
ncbi:MAG TPA: hypothetical protein DGH14_03300 [Roseburia sp.]|uniref:Gallidermin family protein n=1 Tax=Roseburia inulinivorans TaxID=360807 RepID=A0A413TKT2_9FIRM|nr:gallidermin family protein [Roseburia inulinivorans]MBP8773544.1 gallidermin family lantibiotic [Roseburia sp.]MCC3342273.1 gallidermin family lantibiotic [Roseburia inulinivorans DSM 16841]MBS6242197.1 gallidermin family lantibiotic [Roseburia sp.]MBS7145983.1 gallidermin family lantibiotic [Roseburia sp.]